ncbi:MAG: hypothetical protein AMXMBFR64_06350 [Myxococcales bacterium]
MSESPDAPATEGPPPFETILTELETLVARLEAGNLPLDESLRLFERGMALSRQGSTLLDQAERRVEVLLRGPDGDPQIQPFEGPEEPR